MLRFISLGSGSCGNSYILESDFTSIMIDAGIGIRKMKRLASEYGVNLSAIKHLFLTHDHADHIKCAGVISTDQHVHVYATEKVHSGIDGNYCVKKKVPLDMRMIIEKNEKYNIGEFCIMPFAVPHDASDNVGYRIEVQGVVFVLVTDAGKITEEIAKHINDANYLVLEANYDPEMLERGPYPAHLKARISSGYGHLSNIETANALISHASPSLKHVFLCHLSEENNHPELVRKTLEHNLRGQGIVIGADFSLDVLRRAAPTGWFDFIR